MLLLIVFSLIIAIAFVLYFFYKPVINNKIDEKTSNIILGKQKIKDLSQDIKDNILSSEQLEQAELDIKQTLSYELTQNTDKLTVKNFNKPIYAILIIVFMVFASLGMYYKLGTTDINTKLNSLESVASLTELEAFVSRNPDNLLAVKSLAYSYFSSNQLIKSKELYQRAYNLNNRDIDVLIEYASTLAALQNNSLEGKPASLLKQALEIDGNNISALYLAGLAAYQSGQLKLVKKAWTRALNNLDKSSKDYQTILTQLNALDSQINIVQNTPQELSISPSIQVNISLSASIKDKVSPDDFVLIYAKNTTGRPVPLAIVKKQVKDLPITIILSDKHAMLDDFNLSSANNIIVIARISKTGKALKQRGDIEQKSQIISLIKNPKVKLNLIITK